MPNGPRWPPSPPTCSDSEPQPIMNQILHILTQPAKPSVEQLILDQRQLPDQKILVISLNQENPDYRLLLEKVFQSDSIECW
jgi:hypothetical protein